MTKKQEKNQHNKVFKINARKLCTQISSYIEIVCIHVILPAMHGNPNN